MTHWTPTYRPAVDLDDVLSRGWSLADGNALVRELWFRDFDEAFGFVSTVADDAVDHLRRPDMAIYRTSRVRLTIANVHHAGLTAAELRLLEKVEAVIERVIGPEAR